MKVAIEQKNPLCPNCSRTTHRPFSGSFRDLTFQQKFGWHEIACVCGEQYWARYYDYDQDGGIPEPVPLVMKGRATD